MGSGDCTSHSFAATCENSADLQNDLDMHIFLNVYSLKLNNNSELIRTTVTQYTQQLDVPTLVQIPASLRRCNLSKRFPLSF
jgi:hypothetical protein